MYRSFTAEKNGLIVWQAKIATLHLCKKNSIKLGVDWDPAHYMEMWWIFTTIALKVHISHSNVVGDVLGSNLNIKRVIIKGIKAVPIAAKSNARH